MTQCHDRPRPSAYRALVTSTLRSPVSRAITLCLLAPVFVLASFASPLLAGAQPAQHGSIVLGDSNAPAPRSGATLAFDGQQRRLLMFGGGTDPASQLLDTWSWDGTNWQLLDEQGPVDAGATMVYDDSSRQLLLITQPGGSGGDAGIWNLAVGRRYVARPATKHQSAGGVLERRRV
jgi:hypothetical protein